MDIPPLLWLIDHAHRHAEQIALQAYLHPDLQHNGWSLHHTNVIDQQYSATYHSPSLTLITRGWVDPDHAAGEAYWLAAHHALLPTTPSHEEVRRRLHQLKLHRTWTLFYEPFHSFAVPVTPSRSLAETLHRIKQINKGFQI